MTAKFVKPAIFTEYQLLQRIEARHAFLLDVVNTQPSLSKLLARSLWRMGSELERRGLLKAHAERIRSESEVAK